MSAKVYEIAAALHKGTNQIFSDLQELNVPVEKIGEDVSDQDILKLAEQYERRDYVLQLISNEYISELAKMWNEEELIKLLPELHWSRSFLSSKEAERISKVKEYLKECVETVSSSLVTYRVPKVLKALYLIGRDENAILFPKDGSDLQVFLIPKTKEETASCCICFDKKKMIHTNIDVRSCMILVWVDGRYFYETAQFTKIQNQYYLELDRFFKERGIEPPKFQKIHWRKKGIWDMKAFVQPGEVGFAVQKKSECTLKIDKNKLCICDGTVDTIFWSADDARMTIKGRAVIKNAVNDFLEKTGEMNCEQLQMEAERIEAAFEQVAKKYEVRIPILHTKGL